MDMPPTVEMVKFKEEPVIPPKVKKPRGLIGYRPAPEPYDEVAKQRIRRDRVEIFILILDALSKNKTPTMLSTYNIAGKLYGVNSKRFTTRTRAFLIKLAGINAINGYEHNDAERWTITEHGRKILKKYKKMLTLLPDVFKGAYMLNL
jgi:predicted transcriptional regulator